MVGSIKDYTTHLKLIIPRFDVATWHDFMESNFRAIDALFYNLYGINNFSGEWSKVTQYTKDQVIFIGEDIDLDGNHTIYEGRLVKVLQDHTTDNSDYFNIYQSLHPEYYQLFFDANNAEVFAENAFNYMNTTEEYKNFTESLKNLYEDYLNQTNAAKNDAQSAANDANLSKNEAETAANTAIQTVNTATDLLNEVEEFTQEALSTINATKDSTIETVNHTKDEAISTIQETVENAQKTVDEKITTAEEELDDTIRTAIVEAKDEVKAEADKAIQNAGEIATNYAKEGVTTYTNEVIVPRLDESIQDAQSYAEQAQISANNSQNSAENAESSANLASNHENNARDYASSASVSANKAEDSENSCREILERVGTVIKIIGRVDTVEDLPTSGNINGDAYLVGEEGLESYPEYYWYNDHWEFLGTTSTKISWEVINAALPDQTGNDGKFFRTNGTEASWQYGINDRGFYSYATQYYPGDLVMAYTQGSYHWYLCTSPTKGESTPSGSYWRDLTGYITNFYPNSSDQPILSYTASGWTAGTMSGIWLSVPGNKTNYEKLPTISQYSGVMKVPAGIEGYYTSEQVDDLISTAGANVDNKSITKNTDNQIQAVGVIEKNTGAVKYDWIGTLAEYNAQNVETLHPDWVCYITDDVSGGTSVYTKTETDSAISNALDNVYTKAETDAKLLPKQDVGTAVNYDNISNCITEIPQDIKLELNDGTLTLKAGSKVYVPNGSGVFDVVTIQSDRSISPTGLSRQDMFCLNPNGGFAYNRPVNFHSGSVAPSGSQYMTWYDTANNLVKITSDGGSTWHSGYSLPIGLFTSTSKITSIDQIFNGFGYIGSTVFALPGVKGLIPNGRNADGTLKNIEFTTSSVLTYTSGYSFSNGILIKSDGLAVFANSTTTPVAGKVCYVEKENRTYASLDTVPYALVGNVFSGDSSKISGMQIPTTFHALDYNDKSIISGWAMPSTRYINLTLGASGSTYTAPANGWFVLVGQATGNWGSVNIRCEQKQIGISTVNQTNGEIRAFLPVEKNDIITVYTGLYYSLLFRFIYAEGEN